MSQESTILTDKPMVSDAKGGGTNTDIQVHKRAAEQSHVKGNIFHIHASDSDIFCGIQISICMTICPKAGFVQMPCQSCTHCAA